MPGSSKCSPSFRFLSQNPVCTSSFPHTCYIIHPSHSSQFDHNYNICSAVQIIKLLIMQFSPFPCHLVPLRPYYQVISNILSLCSFLSVKAKFHTHTKWREKL
jgi:hypothetical protein